MKGHAERERNRYYVVLELDPTTDVKTRERERHRMGAGAYRTRRDADAALQELLDRGRRGWRGPSNLTLGDYLLQDWLSGVEMELADHCRALSDSPAGVRHPAPWRC